MKLNITMFKNQICKIGYVDNNKFYNVQGNLLNVVQKKDTTMFSFEDKILKVKNELIKQMKIRQEDNIYIFYYDKNTTIVSGFLLFTMMDTYGFPIELTEEILIEKGYTNFDYEGLSIIQKLNKQMSRTKSKFESAYK